MNAETALTRITEQLAGWKNALIDLLPNLVVALLVLILFFVIGRVAAAWTRRSMRKTTRNEALVSLLSSVVKLAVVVAGACIALAVLRLDGAVASVLAGVGVLGLALGFAFQDIASNFVSGVLLAMHRPFEVGDMIETNGYMATVHEINLRSTVLRSFAGQIITLPNKDVFGSAIVNYNTTNQWRVEIPIGVSYGDDLEKAERVAVTAIEGLDERDPDQPIQLWYTGFGESSIDFSLRFWVKMPEQDFLSARHQAIKAVKKAFDEHGVTIPFPIRTLDFGSAGGASLEGALRGRPAAGGGH